MLATGSRFIPRRNLSQSGLNKPICYALDVKFPPQAQVFEHSVPSWLLEKAGKILGYGTLPEEGSQGRVGLLLSYSSPTSCPLSASWLWMQCDQPTSYFRSHLPSLLPCSLSNMDRVPLERWVKASPSSCELLLAGFFFFLLLKKCN